jgi:tRNA modification GTPase
MNDTIVAISTPQGLGAIGLIRLSGIQAVEIADRVFSKQIAEAKGYTLHFGQFLANGKTLDEVLLTVFRGPRSFTREDVVEISFHGSPYILREALATLLTQGARLANAGEFTQRAYLNGAMDLAQAEAVADLIASGSAQAHHLAMQQMRGGISRELQALRSRLLDFTSLLELELDFGEEDVEFADRKQFDALLVEMLDRIARLIRSFSFGNAVKEGVPTAIIGRPNAGKSTLLNQLLQDNRAIVSAIAGTTRDSIEERLVLDGIEFRLQDTAGIRDTVDEIEAEGVQRSIGLAQRASVVVYLYDPAQESEAEVTLALASLQLPAGTRVLRVANKVDLNQHLQHAIDAANSGSIAISAKLGDGIEHLKSAMVAAVRSYWEGDDHSEAVVVSNVRHLQALRQTFESLSAAREAMITGLSGDLVAIDIRDALYALGSITGAVSTDEILGNIFGKFCIGK